MAGILCVGIPHPVPSAYKTYVGLHVIYPTCSVSTEIRTSSNLSKNHQCQISWKCVQSVSGCYMRSDRRAERLLIGVGKGWNALRVGTLMKLYCSLRVSFLTHNTRFAWLDVFSRRVSLYEFSSYHLLISADNDSSVLPRSMSANSSYTDDVYV